jgi:AcrR family transcriptional regulator
MKEKILAAAIDAFSLKGIRNTTIRDIAQTMEISDGHLRYYFKTKEDLILYVFNALVDELSSQTADVTVKGFEAFRQSVTRGYRIMTRYTFFFAETPYGIAEYPKLAAAWKALFERRQQEFLGIFEFHKITGIFRKDIPEAQYKLLAEQTFIVGEHWITHCKSYMNTTIGEQEIHHFVNVTLALFLPFLTETYAHQLRTELADAAPPAA